MASSWKRDLKLGHREKKNLPPGPSGLPIIGNLLLIDRTNPHHSIHSLSLLHGPLMLLRMGSVPTVVGSSAEMAKIFLTLHDSSFSSRPTTTAGQLLNYNCSNIGWAPYGPYWLQARRLCSLRLLSAARLESFLLSRSDEARELTRRLFAVPQPTTSIKLKHLLWKASLNMLSVMVFGSRRDDSDFTEMVDEFMKLDGLTDIGEIFPCFKFMDLLGNEKRMKKVSRRFDAFWEDILKDRRRLAGGGDDDDDEPHAAADLVDVLLSLLDDPSLDPKLHRNSIKAFSQDVIAAGTGSCAGTVEWAMAELLRQPQMLEKAAEELDRVVGRERWVEEKDMARLPYLTSVVKEAMRLHPIAPLLIPHLSREDRNVAGYDIPAGTKIVVNVYTIMRDPAVWESPLEFRPERFLERPTDVTGEDHSLLPFGAGSRMCPGHALGLKMVQLLLARLLQGFRWRLPAGVTAEDVSMEEVFGLATTMKVPLEAVAEPRLPAAMYGP